MGPRADMDGCGKYRSNVDSIPGPTSPWRVDIYIYIYIYIYIKAHTSNMRMFGKLETIQKHELNNGINSLHWHPKASPSWNYAVYCNVCDSESLATQHDKL